MTVSNRKAHVNDCLVTLATPVGRAAIATVLVCGEEATDRADMNFQAASGLPLKKVPLNHIAFGNWNSSDGMTEELVVCCRSGQLVEIHCHGGTAAPEAVISSLVDAGCRRVDWQQWLRLTTDDPIIAEARIALSAARTTRTAEILLNQLNGALREAIDRLIRFLQSNETEPATQIIDRLLSLSEVGLHLATPWQVVLAGAPNVGKSSLINAILGYQRAIVYHQPGTTRDIVAAATVMDGWPVELADTAGLRTAEGAIEEEGIKLARHRAAQADLLLLVFDASQPWSNENSELLNQYPRPLVVYNKCDLTISDSHCPDGVYTSAVHGDGIQQLMAEIVSRLISTVPESGEAVPFTQRQIALLADASDRLTVDDRNAAITLLEEI